MFQIKLNKKTDKRQVVFAFVGNGVVGAYQDLNGQTCFTKWIDLSQESEKKALTAFLLAQNLIGAHCGIVMPPASYHVFLIDKPAVNPDKLLDAIRWKMTEYIDFPLESAIIDYIEIPCKAKAKEHKKVYAIIAHQSMVQEKKELIESLGLKVKFIDIPESTLKNLSLTMPESEKGLCLVKINQTSVELIIIRKGLMLLLRKVELDLSETQAENSMTSDKVIQELALEIQRSIDYCSTHFIDVTSSKIKILTPLELPLDKLNQILGVEVSIFEDDAVSNEEDIASMVTEGRLYAKGGLLRAHDEANH